MRKEHRERRVVVCDRLDVSASDNAAIRELSAAVYPPDEEGEWAGRSIEWATSHHRALVWEDSTLVSHVGIVRRDAIHDGHERRVGGIGGVMTHPSARGRGLAAAGIESALDALRTDCDFGLLVCEPALLAYYGSQGWEPFAGTLLTLQHGATVPFTFNEVMVIGLRGAAPADGVIDLLGPPW